VIKAILFDFGGVIALNNFDDQLDNFAQTLKIKTSELKAVEEANHEKLVLGKLSVKEFCNSIRNRFGLTYESSDIAIIWDKIYANTTKINGELLTKITELKKKYMIGLMSNIFESTAQFHQRQKIFFYFKPVLLSCRIGLAKPHSGIFERAIKDTHLKASEILYIDDNQAHLETAKKLGMKTILFKNNKQLFKEMQKLKIK
jgi:epoxide hydrolase-like predicted phosphatase